MKRVWTSALVVLLLAGASQALILPSVPRQIPYQGRLTDGSGTPLNGAYLVRFVIYDAPTGGTALWDNSYRKINVSNGLFTYTLGDSTILPYTIFTSDTLRWLGITVGADPEMTPRTKLNSVAYAYKASLADTAETVVYDSHQPGFAAGSISSPPAITGTDTVIASCFFSPPENGYALIISQSAFATSSTSTWLNCRLRRNGTYDVESWYWDPGDADPWVDQTQMRISVDTVTKFGLYNYQLVVSQSPSGTSNPAESRLIVIYFPYRYDPISSPPSPNAPFQNLNGLIALSRATQAQGETAGTASLATPQSIEAELSEIKSERDALDQRIERLEEAITHTASGNPPK